ncbi:L,D-transpeptidase catalytic domain [Hartmannibacter diazotrophicus]|uniref:L,D-transpeptidase catalytic domain n=1 Tax=Hartmannibacter diazotrophicus TaxID=1482074 RepID=A0A2C9DDC6_9HYPH|nr:L,D-transpeptidase family protein [Hartmannibacter diazotrophicus]SON58169.1 L,D-transpeptidase catalytic domain [Hartmannibacter diazotrophicus]
MRLSRSGGGQSSRFRDHAPDLTVHLISASRTAGRLAGAGFDLRCAIGRAGITARKREGDGASPAGRFAILGGYYRADRIGRPETALPLRPIRSQDGWCDAPGDRNYNRPVRLPYAASHERLWRDDHLYDIVLVLDANLTRRRRGRGSAIFFHLARSGYAPTEGCVAVSLADMKKLLAKIRPGSAIVFPLR